MRYFSMFTGIGGFELGLKKASKEFKCIGFSEIDKYSCQVLKYRFPEVKNYGDATKINPNELPDFDMLCGGFPCQSFSIAGKRRGFKDTRGTLFFEIARILKVKRPQLVFLENVKGLLNHDKGETFKVIIQSLGELGYDVQWMVLNSKFFGVPQNRERVFIIGNLRGTSRPKILPFKRANQISDSMLPSKNIQVREKTRTNYIKYEDSKDSVDNYINTNNWQDYIYDSKMRKLTPVECCRLQGFPDDWVNWGIDKEGNKIKISDSQKYKMMGNAVTTNVIKAIANKLKIITNFDNLDITLTP